VLGRMLSISIHTRGVVPEELLHCVPRHLMSSFSLELSRRANIVEMISTRLTNCSLQCNWLAGTPFPEIPWQAMPRDALGRCGGESCHLSAVSLNPLDGTAMKPARRPHRRPSGRREPPGAGPIGFAASHLPRIENRYPSRRGDGGSASGRKHRKHEPDAPPSPALSCG
jgi:hypothetical protein